MWKRQEKQRLRSREGWRNCDTFFFFHSIHHEGGPGIKCEIRAGEHTPYLFRPEMSGESFDWMLAAVINKYRAQTPLIHDARENIVLAFVWSETIKFAIGSALSPDQPSASYFKLYLSFSQCPSDSASLRPLIANEPQCSNLPKIGFVYLVANCRPLKKHGYRHALSDISMHCCYFCFWESLFYYDEIHLSACSRLPNA